MDESQKNNSACSVGLHEALKDLEVRIPPKGSECNSMTPREFFRDTYVTAGLRELVLNVARRLSGDLGPNVYELNARSGGGKTHALLTLYYMTDAGASVDVPELRELLFEASLSLPENVNRVVITRGLRHPRTPVDGSDGGEIKTLWGEIAWQLGGRDAYQVVADHDRTGRPPKAHLLIELLSAHSPCLILVDDLLPYLRHVRQGSETPYEALRVNLDFIFSLSLAVREASGIVMVISEPEVFHVSDRWARDMGTAFYIFFKFAERCQPACPAEMLQIARKRLCVDVEHGSDPMKHTEE
jgi:predicted AAA+ superfamily ATPase